VLPSLRVLRVLPLLLVQLRVRPSLLVQLRALLRRVLPKQQVLQPQQVLQQRVLPVLLLLARLLRHRTQR